VSPSLNILASLRVDNQDATVPPFVRSEWSEWGDSDGDCQDTRAEVLQDESLIGVTFRDPGGCVVASGQWRSYATGEDMFDASDVDIDHLVPLANAHRAGGWQWSRERRGAFANDLSDAAHLMALDLRSNRTKQDKGPDAWRPQVRGQWCWYAESWARIKTRWDLSVTAVEYAALVEMLVTC
jgi:hypothetical protein